MSVSGAARAWAAAMVVLVVTAAVLALVVWKPVGRAFGPRRGPPPGVTWQRTTEVATGEARVGPWRMNESDWRYVDDPTVAVDSAGSIGVAWVDQSRKDVFFQLYDSAGQARLAEPVNVSSTPRVFSWLPRMVMGGGHIYLLWQEIVFSGGSHGGEICFARSTDGGRSFDAPRNLSNTPAGDGKGRLTRSHWDNGSLDLARGSDGVLLAAWTEYEGALWCSRSEDAGASFSQPLRVGGDPTHPARGPSLAAHSDGTVYLSWAVGEDPRADLRLAVSRDGGRSFGRAWTLPSGPGHQDAPKLAVDGRSVLHLVYPEGAGEPRASDRVLYTRSADGGRTFEPPRPISGSEASSFPSLATDARGGVYVLCELFPDGPGRSRGLGLVTSRDGGRAFSAPAVLERSGDQGRPVNGSLQGMLMRKLAVSDRGVVAVVNSSIRRGVGSRITLYRGRAAHGG